MRVKILTFNDCEHCSYTITLQSGKPMDMDKKIKLTGYIGIVASLLMFAGDMLLYFTTDNFTGRHEELLLSMGNVSFERLVAGGLLGPLAAVLYVVGLYQLYLRTQEVYRHSARVMFALFALSYAVGGAYHAFFPAYGIVSAQGHTELIEPLTVYAGYLAAIAFLPMAAGWTIFTVMTLRRQVDYPLWILFFNPLFTAWLNFLWIELPAPFQVLIGGGWYNLIYTLFFAASILSLKKHI